MTIKRVLDWKKNLLKEDAQKRLDALLYEGLNPKDLKITREK